jgi:membrane-associated phospholipid phosphatase
MIPFFLNIDHDLFCLINFHHSPFWDNFFTAVSWLGSGWVVTPILVGIALLMVPRKKLKNPAASYGESSIPMERKHTYSRSLTPEQAPGNTLAVGFLVFFIFAAAGFIVSSTINTQIKNATHRARPIGYFVTHRTYCPEANKGIYTVHVVGEPLATRSFPSGHANTAVCAACVLAFFFGGWYWLAFAPAFLVAYSRVYMGVHFPLDVAAGGLLGIIVIALAYIAYKKYGAVVQNKVIPFLTNLFPSK